MAIYYRQIYIFRDLFIYRTNRTEAKLKIVSSMIITFMILQIYICSPLCN